MLVKACWLSLEKGCHPPSAFRPIALDSLMACCRTDHCTLHLQILVPCSGLRWNFHLPQICCTRSIHFCFVHATSVQVLTCISSARPLADETMCNILEGVAARL